MPEPAFSPRDCRQILPLSSRLPAAAQRSGAGRILAKRAVESG
ncbi:Hypothetical Protein RSKD131_3335 [Cereibacter sphaeroides KD131]|nr:Hypothetical Protein RSKD131_3335 [Cereibacter sphaeroides KD131]